VIGLGLLSGSNSSSLYCRGSGCWCRAYADGGGGGGGRSGPYVGVSFRTLLVAGTVEFTAIWGLGVLQLDLEDEDVEGDGGSFAGARVGLGGRGEGSCHLCQVPNELATEMSAGVQTSLWKPSARTYPEFEIRCSLGDNSDLLRRRGVVERFCSGACK
jgi:hypothetical protein